MKPLAQQTYGTGERLGVLLHGIMGSKGNWTSIAKRLAQDCPEWRFSVVDLRNHGHSAHTNENNTLQACAKDLLDLFFKGGQEPQWLAGHSFGGKVAMLYAQEFAGDLCQLMVLDSTPGRSRREGISSQVEKVLAVLHSVAMPVKKRDDVVDALLAKGLSLAIAKWMTTNLKRTPDGYQWRFHLAGIVQMLQSYGAYDGWPIFEKPPCASGFVRGGKSDRWLDDDVKRLEGLHSAGKISLFTLENAGHWVHSDDPQGLLTVLTQSVRHCR